VWAGGISVARKIIHLTSVHPTFDPRIFHKECVSLAAEGYEVVLIAPAERDERVKGVRIRAVPRARKRSTRMTKTVWQVYRAAIEEDGDLYHFHDAELITVGLLLSARGKRVVYDVHEDLPRQVRGKHWLPGPLQSVASGLAVMAEGIGAACSAGIVAATPTIAARFPKSKTVVVRNFPVLDEWSVLGSMPYSERPPLIAYVGGVSGVRGSVEMVNAMGLVSPSLCARLALGGNYMPAEHEFELRQLEGWQHVDALGWLSRNDVTGLLGRVRAGFVILHPRPAYMESLPVKLFEYMAAGLPVIVSDFPLWREILSTANCGLAVDPLNPHAIAEAVEWILRNPDEAEAMGARARDIVLRDYNWSREVGKLCGLYSSLR
jgi:glycosyltransferase involved in cell wall biosynthesis